jgi:hypothetical protein
VRGNETRDESRDESRDGLLSDCLLTDVYGGEKAVNPIPILGIDHMALAIVSSWKNKHSMRHNCGVTFTNKRLVSGGVVGVMKPRGGKTWRWRQTSVAFEDGPNSFRPFDQQELKY